MSGTEVTVLDGESLTIDQVLRLSAQPTPAIAVAPAARTRVGESWTLASELATRRPVYGRTTGVGANRDTAVPSEIATDLRLLRSHATGSGARLDDATVRAALLIRLNQLLRGGSGIHPAAIDALQGALAAGCLPVVHATGAIGTGDLSGLAEIALGLLGETPLGESASGERPSEWALRPGDALPFLSSNALTLAAACREAGRLRGLLSRTAAVAALSFLAVRASTECLAPAVQAARAQPGQEEAAAAVRGLLAEVDLPARRVQDSFGYRVYPQVMGALLDAADAFERSIEIDLIAAAENPLIDRAAGSAFHNGNFHGMPLTLAADRVKLGLAAAGQLSVARLTDISDPGMTGLAPFLADTPGGSGAMLLEYNQAAAQDELRHSAQPAALGAAVISRGVENHSSFSTQAVARLGRCIDRLTDVLACEAVAGVRALHLHGNGLPAGSELAAFAAGIARGAPPGWADRSLTAELAAARDALAG